MEYRSELHAFNRLMNILAKVGLDLKWIDIGTPRIADRPVIDDGVLRDCAKEDRPFRPCHCAKTTRKMRYAERKQAKQSPTRPVWRLA